MWAKEKPTKVSHHLAGEEPGHERKKRRSLRCAMLGNHLLKAEVGADSLRLVWPQRASPAQFTMALARSHSCTREMFKESTEETSRWRQSHTRCP